MSLLSSLSSVFQSSNSDLPTLLHKFCQRHTKSDPSIQQFCHSIRKLSDEQQATVFIKVFGRLQTLKVLKALDAISPLNVTYQTQCLNLIQDVGIILKYNLENIKTQKLLAPLPQTESNSYSWNSHSAHLDQLNNEEYARHRMIFFFLNAEMPIPLAKTLNFHQISFLSPHLEKYAKELNDTIQTVYKVFKDKPETPLSDFYSNPGKFISLQQMLMRHAASAEYPTFTSWMEELISWGKDRVEFQQDLKHFKLCYLIDLVSQKYLTTQQNISFQHYLIKKTLGQIPFSIPEATYNALVAIFEQAEYDRQVTCFFIYILNDIFNQSSSAQKYSLREMIALTNPNPQSLDRALEILNRLAENTNPITYRVLESLAHVYVVNHLNQFHLSVPEQACLFEWAYQQSNLALVRVYEEMSQQKAGYTAFYSNPFQPTQECEKAILERIWHFMLADLAPLPLRFYHSLADITAKVDQITRQSAFSCVDYLLSLYKSSVPVLDPLNEGSKILEQDILKKERPLYSLLHSLFLFVNVVYCVPLNPEGKALLLHHLLDSDQEERLACQEELTTYFKKLKNSDKKPSDIWLERLKAVFQSYSAKHPYYEVFTKLLAEWPNSILTSNIHIEVIQRIEEFSQNRIPLTVVLVMLFYPVFLPEMLQSIQELVALRQKLSSTYQQHFLLPPSLVKRRDELMGDILDPELVISSTYLCAAGFPASQLEFHLGTIATFLNLSVLQEPVFAKSIGKNAAVLFPALHNATTQLHQNTLSLLVQALPTSIAYLSTWTRQEGMYPQLHLTFIRSMQNPESQSIHVELQIENKELDQEPFLWELLNKFIVELSHDTRDLDWEDKIKPQLSEQEEFQLCLSISKPLHDAWEAYCQQTQRSNPQEIGLKLLRFMKKLKIETRMALTQIFHSQTTCHLKKTELQQEFIHLSQVLRQATSPQVIKNFCCFELGREKYSVDISFDPLLIDSEKVRKKSRGFYNAVTFHLDDPKSTTYTVQYKDFLVRPELENMLRWQLRMLKAHLYKTNDVIAC